MSYLTSRDVRVEVADPLLTRVRKAPEGEDQVWSSVWTDDDNDVYMVVLITSHGHDQVRLTSHGQRA